MKTKTGNWISITKSDGQRTRSRQQNSIALAVVMLIGLGSPPVDAGAAVFTIDSSRSYLSLSANLLGMAIEEQGPGSLTTALSGVVNVELSPTTIQFTGGSLLDASTNGSWQPLPGGGAGEAPADFAAKTQNPLFGTIFSAVRNIILDLQSAVLWLNGADFDGSQVQFISPTNSLAAFDYNSGYLAGSKSLAGTSTNKLANGSTVTVNAGVQTLIFPIDAQFPFSAFLTNDSVVAFSGRIVATRPLESTTPTPLAIQSIVLGNSQLLLRVKGVPEASSHLESSLDLKRWEACPSEMSAEGDTYIVSRKPSARSEYYRLAR